MEYCRALSDVEEKEASAKGIPGCFHSNVLYKRVDRKRFETDPVFRSNYRKANLAPVWQILGPLPPPDVVEANLDAAKVNVETRQQRAGKPGRVDRKIEKNVQEKRKGAGRKPQGLRGLLSKMNFFS